MCSPYVGKHFHLEISKSHVFQAQMQLPVPGPPAPHARRPFRRSRVAIQVDQPAVQLPSTHDAQSVGAVGLMGLTRGIRLSIGLFTFFVGRLVIVMHGFVELRPP